MKKPKKTVLVLALLAVLLLAALAAWWLVGWKRTSNQTSPSSAFLPEDAMTSDETEPALGTPDTGSPVPTGDLEEPPSDPLSLIGTTVASDARWSSASIADEQDSTAIYRLRDELPDGSMLIAIRSSSVRVELEGEQRTLTIVDRRKPKQLAQEDLEQVEETQGLKGVRDAGQGRYHLRRWAVDAWLEKGRDSLTGVRFSLSLDVDGQVGGLKISELPEGSLLTHLGLAPGDLLHRVGSVILDGPERLSELPALMQNARELDLELTRDGQLFTLRYWID